MAGKERITMATRTITMTVHMIKKHSCISFNNYDDDDNHCDDEDADNDRGGAPDSAMTMTKTWALMLAGDNYDNENSPTSISRMMATMIMTSTENEGNDSADNEDDDNNELILKRR